MPPEPFHTPKLNSVPVKNQLPVPPPSAPGHTILRSISRNVTAHLNFATRMGVLFTLTAAKLFPLTHKGVVNTLVSDRRAYRLGHWFPVKYESREGIAA